ncbi:MAG: LysR family transcriptional regulator [Alphaproteobacteria bacterium]|nr:LysR family transcriptional regulator [Alphaproteobacteria bacterium]
MNVKQIDAVLELAKTLNFNRAAEKLCVSQPTLSYEIKELENEVGFKIFERSGKGAVLTPAGMQFSHALKNIRAELKNAVEQGQNFSSQYSSSIIIGIPVRSMLKRLPQAMMEFSSKFPDVSIVPRFIGFYKPEAFLSGQIDILAAMDFELKHIPDVKQHRLYECGISLVMRDDDILSSKEKITKQDLEGRTLLVGGGSPPMLQRLQQRLIRTQTIKYLNSSDHDTTLTYVAAQKAVCLSPDFFNEDTTGFKRITFDCPEKFKIVLCTHSTDKRESLQYFVKLLQKLHE